MTAPAPGLGGVAPMTNGPTDPGTPHEGQLIVNRSCASGRCHSADATGDNRVGAPADLNFDVVMRMTSTPQESTAEFVKITDGAANVLDHREAIWEQIDDGHMPPPKPAGSGELSAADKEKVRNWLACGPEVIAAPEPIQQGTDWNSIYESLRGMCMSCHGGSAVAGDGFMFGDMNDACGAYARVVNVDAITDDGVPPCAGTGKLVVPNDPDASILYQKLRGNPSCGSPMPLATTGLGEQNPIVQNLRAWIMDGAPAPTCP